MPFEIERICDVTNMKADLLRALSDGKEKGGGVASPRQAEVNFEWNSCHAAETTF